MEDYMENFLFVLSWAGFIGSILMILFAAWGLELVEQYA